MNISASPRGGFRWVSLVAALLAVVLLAGLGVVAGRPDVAAWERGLFAVVNGLGGGWWPPLYVVMQAGTLAAGPVAAGIAFVLGRRRLAGQLAVAGVAAWLLARVVKVMVARPRPVLLLPSVVLRGGEAGGLGYPSGHVTVAMALAAVLAAWLPRSRQWPLWTVVAAVGVARIYAGAHLPLDVVGGVLLGGLVGAGVRLASGARGLRAPE